MAHKMAFRFNRTSYAPETMREHNPTIRTRLQGVMDAKSIVFNHMFPPARNSIKAILPNEKEVDKIMANYDYFKSENIEPKISLALKAKRTSKNCFAYN